MALTIDETWIRERVKLKHDHLDDVKSLSLPGTYQEKISFLGNSLRSFTRLKNLDLSRNSLTNLEGLESLQLLENLNLYYNNISSIRDLGALRHLNNLKELDLRLNPVTKNEPDYRLHIVHMLPNLKRLDDRSVRDSERRAALMHFTSDQASDFDEKNIHSNKIGNERTSLPRPDMVKKLGPRNTVFEDDDVAILDMITRAGGDLNQPRRITGSSSRKPDLADFNRDEIHSMQPYGTPRQQRQDDILNKKNRSPSRIKDRVYVQFADDTKDKGDELLKYTDESTAYSSLNTRGHFTANPLVNGHADNISAPKSHELAIPPLPQTIGHTQDLGRAYDIFSPDKHHGYINSRSTEKQQHEASPTHTGDQRWISPQRSQGALADRIRPDLSPVGEYNNDGFTNGIDQASDSSDKLTKLLDLVDRYWNGSKSLHRNAKFQSMAHRLFSSDMSLVQPSTPGKSEKLQMELSERTSELSRLREKVAEQKRDLDSLHYKIKTQDMLQGNLDDTNKELSNIKSKLKEVNEENVLLKAKTASLEAKHLSVTEQEKQLGELIKRNGLLEEKVQSLNSQMSQQNKNLLQLQELTNMLQESHRSLVATNDHLLRELDETRQRHSSEVQQMHWSYDKLKNSLDWLPNGSR